MKEKICIVIPVYNVEKYVKKCIESVKKQSYSNIEIILVNDGSTDNSLKVCLECSKDDKRIKVVSKENGGLSDARNFGMNYCSSKLITFIDSDDYVSEDYIKNLYDLMIQYNSDISCTNYIETFEDGTVGKKIKKTIIKKLNPNSAIIDVLYQKNIANSAWGKLYKFDFFNDIEFPKGKLCEDLGTFYKLFEKANSIVYSSVQDYYYLQRGTSIMGSSFNERKLDALEFATDIFERYKNSNEMKKASKSRICAECVNLLNQIPNEKKIIKQEVKNVLKKYWISVVFDIKVKLIVKLKIILKIMR